MTLVLLHELAQVAVRSATEFVASKSVVRQKWEGNA